jgi:hypothetical protein
VAVSYAAVDLVGAHEEKAAHAALTRGLEQRVRAVHVRAQELVGAQVGAVHVRFGRHVHHRVDPVHHLQHQAAIADVPVDEAVARMGLDVAQVLQASRVRELVEVDDGIARLVVQDVPDEV